MKSHSTYTKAHKACTASCRALLRVRFSLSRISVPVLGDRPFEAFSCFDSSRKIKSLNLSMLSIFFNSISICGLSSRLFLRNCRELILASRSSVFWRILCSVCFVANRLPRSRGRLITSRSFGLVDITSLIVSHCENQDCGLRSVGRSFHLSSTPDFKIHVNLSLIEIYDLPWS
jgi:hypothetical protein